MNPHELYDYMKESYIEEKFEPTVSIVVPVKNGEATIGDLLNSLTQLDYNKKKVEIIVVDGNSTDRTREIAAKYPVKLIKENGKGLNAARNTGVAQSTGEIIAFTDADCVAPPDWLRKLVRNFKNPNVGCVGGSTKGYYEDFLSKYSDNSIIPVLRRFKKYETRDNVGALLQYPAGCNMALRKIAIEKAGGFDESIHFGFDEDELVERICKEQRYKLVLDPDLYIKHKHRTKLRELLKQNFRYGRGNALLLKRKKCKSAYSFGAVFTLAGFSAWLLAAFIMLLLAITGNSMFHFYSFLGIVFLPYIGLMIFYTIQAIRAHDLLSIFIYPAIDYLRVATFYMGEIYQILRFDKIKR